MRLNLGARIMSLRSMTILAGLNLALMCGASAAAPIGFGYTGAFTSYTIGTSGIYSLVAFGAQGGRGDGIALGGLGAEIGGEFSFTKGQVINIAVGGQGTAAGNIYLSGGGGGGTFVTLAGATRALDTALVIAGGGGGAGHFDTGGAGLSTSSGGNGDGNQGGQGGSAGTGGGASRSRFPDFGGTGGGGFLTDGGGLTVYAIPGGSSYANGLAGSNNTANNNGGGGGFGGGGSGVNSYGGGGGGYSGGGGAGDDTDAGFAGGGGGSFLNLGVSNYISGFDVASSGVQFGNGFVSLDLVSATMSPVPLPASAPMFGAALLALGAVGYGVKRKKAAATA